jgi:hypothetical protein
MPEWYDTGIHHNLGRPVEVSMRREVSLKRKSFFVDERALRRAKKALGVATDAEVVRLSLEQIAEMQEYWRFMKSSRRTLRPGSIRTP